MASIIKKYYNIWTVLATMVLFFVLYNAVLYPRMNQWGLTPLQANMPLPGDGTQAGMMIASTRGVTVQSPASQVWQWLVQIGADQAGFYSNDWLENLVLSDIHNANTIQPAWQSHQKGEPILGASGLLYQKNFTWPTQAYENGKMLYLWGPIVVLPLDGQSTLLVTRSYVQSKSFIMEITYDWMHFVMERGMLLGIKARAEGNLYADLWLQILAKTGFICSTLAMAFLLFVRRRGWWWGLLPLAYAAAIITYTADIWSAMAGFLWWGVIASGFVILGRNYWKSLILATELVILIFIFAPQPFLAFGILFLLITITACSVRISGIKSNLSNWLEAKTSHRQSA